MKFAIITHVSHVQKSDEYFGYAPYVREMNIWIKYVDKVIIVAPITKSKVTEIDIAYKHHNVDFREVADFSFISFKSNLESLLKLPLIIWRIFWAMYDANHIHLRCPGNMGLVGCFIQILFPSKIKTAKYAGNWAPGSKQPWTYKLQKYILNNTFLTKNMQVLVYGDWKNQTKNIKSFFTATYSENEKENISKSNLNIKAEFIFVGSLVSGKNPLYAIMLIKDLIGKGLNATLNLYGDGIEKSNLEIYIKENKLEGHIILHGNQNKEIVKKAYQKSHFVILPSKSEGWPKAIAEGMFWGCVPLATKVSCVPFMLDYGARGVMLEMDLEKDFTQINTLLKNHEIFIMKSKLAQEWSQTYTTDFFEKEIKNLL
ncbi:glycosyltransferase [Flavobacterium zhairuonense]|nr:glycosyltransferase [Flavobacterium zhairuonense]